MKTLKEINKHLLNKFGLEIERVSNMSSVVRQSLKGIKFILRDGNINEDFETFKDLKQFVSKLK